MNIREFQTDLNKGMTISDACQKHQITFKQAFQMLHYKDTNKQKTQTSQTREQYITINKNTGKYELKRRINGKYKYFGSYPTLKDAIRMREYMKTHGWTNKKWQTIKKELNL